MSGSASERVAVVTASARSLPALMCPIDDPEPPNITCTCPLIRSVSAGATPRYGTCTMSTPVIILNSSPAIWEGVPIPPDAILSLIGLGISDELGNRFCWNREIRHHELGHASDACDRRDVTVEIETKLAEHRGLDRVGPVAKEIGEATGGERKARLGSDILATAGSVIDHEWLAEPL